MKKYLVSVAAAAACAIAVSAQAASVDIDMAGWQSAGGFGAAGNSEVFLDIGAGSTVTGFDYIGLAFSTQGTSWLSELVLSVNNATGSEYLDQQPSLVDAPGSFGPASGSWNAVDGFGAPFTVNDGTLWVTVYEAYNDAGIDAIVSQGTLRVYYDAAAPIPEPGTYALMALGLAAVGAVARRRRV